MSNQQSASLAFAIVAALISVAVPQVSLAAGKFGIGAPVVKQTSVVQAREIQVSSTGDGSASEDECKKYEAGKLAGTRDYLKEEANKIFQLVYVAHERLPKEQRKGEAACNTNRK